MKWVLTLVALLGMCVSIVQADGFLCTPYKNGEPASGTIYCAYLNSIPKWEIWGSIFSDGTPKRFCDNSDSADVRIYYYHTYMFCAWDGAYRSQWTSPILYEPGVSETYDLNMNIFCPAAPDPKVEE